VERKTTTTRIRYNYLRLCIMAPWILFQDAYIICIQAPIPSTEGSQLGVQKRAGLKASEASHRSTPMPRRMLTEVVFTTDVHLHITSRGSDCALQLSIAAGT